MARKKKTHGDGPREKLRGAAKRTRAQRESDMLALAQWRVEGRSIEDFKAWIAQNRTYTLSRTVLFEDYQEVKRRWTAEQMDAVQVIRSRQLAILDAQEREAWAEWHKSKTERMRRHMEEAVLGKDADGRPKTTPGKRSVTQENQCGDVQYQRLILEIGARRAKLLGLDAPTEVTGAGGTPLGLGTPVINVIVNRKSEANESWEARVLNMTGTKIDPIKPG